MEHLHSLIKYSSFVSGKNPDASVGGKVQSDWNQTDETAADFIKNKPFYETENVILEEQELYFEEEMQAYIGEVSDTINDRDALKVVLNGNVYATTAVMMEGSIVFGNLALLDVGEDTGEPFAGVCQAGMVVIIHIDATSLTAKIYKADAEKLPHKYFTAQTVFYLKDGGDCYVYVDVECTVKATASDVVKALTFGAISLHYMINGRYLAQVQSVLYAHTNGSYWEMLTSATSKRYYTAEYTPET